jgi:hypothetical protein
LLVEGLTKSEVCKRGREVINWLVKMFTKSDVGEGGGEVIY